jgi:hypothetical protein
VGKTAQQWVHFSLADWDAELQPIAAAPDQHDIASQLLESARASPFFISVRFHWPMQGPHALASTVPPTFSNTSIRPSRSMVARICSLPGVIVNGTCRHTANLDHVSGCMPHANMSCATSIVTQQQQLSPSM